MTIFWATFDLTFFTDICSFKTCFVVNILRFKSGLMVIFWNFKSRYDVDSLAFFGLATYLAIFSKIGQSSGHTYMGKARGPYTRISLLDGL